MVDMIGTFHIFGIVECKIHVVSLRLYYAFASIPMEVGNGLWPCRRSGRLRVH
jgi:hypothetical protein